MQRDDIYGKNRSNGGERYQVERYANRDGDSGITRYDIGPDYIRLEFRDSVVYRYDYVRPGPLHVERMKALARDGRGLATYVNQHVRDNYTRRE